MKGCLRSMVIFIALVTIINLVMSLFADRRSTSYDVPESDSACPEISDQDDFGWKHHQRFWGFSEQSRSYCMKYQTSEEVSDMQSGIRGEMSVSYLHENFWGQIYLELVSQTSEKVNFIADSLQLVAQQHNYSALDQARLIVSFVQDIPYSYVLPSDCSEFDTKGKPCLGNIPYGITSPYEFAHSHLGDCDTRAVLLYMLLERLHYDPMIVVSDEYAHAMLALNIPAQGDHLLHGGKKYYFWETTAIGWPIGMLPPDSNNIDYWEIALVNES